MTARAELDRLRAGLDASEVTPQQVVDALIGEKRLWWECCRESVRHDPRWLLDGDAAAVLRFLAARVTGPAERSAAAVEGATVAFHAARALCGAPMSELDAAIRRWSVARVVPPRPTGAELLGTAGQDIAEESTRRRLYAVIEAIPVEYGDPARAMTALTTLLLAADDVRERPLVRVSVVFGRPGGGQAEEGAAGTLELRELRGGPSGIFPDLRSMAAVHADEAFLRALAVAWEISPGQRGGRCVLWRLVVDDAPPTSVEGPSLGAAFALALREVLRRPVSPRPSVAWLRLLMHRFFHGPRPRTALTGEVDEREDLRAIGYMGQKFLTAHEKGWRLVAPQGNSGEIGCAPDPDAVEFAENLDEAAAYMRRTRTGRAAGVVAGVAVVATAIYGTYAVGSQAASRQHTADRLASLSKSLLNTDLRLAQLFAVRAYRTAADSQTRSALFNAVAAAPHLVRFMEAGEQVSVLTASGDGRTALAGTRSGTVLRFDLASGRRGVVFRAGPSLTGLSTDATTTTVVALAGHTARLWTADGGVRNLVMPAGQDPSGIGVSPSGRSIVVSTTDAAGGLDTPGHTVLYDRDGRVRASSTAHGPLTGFSEVTMPDDTQVVSFEGGYGGWERRSLPGLRLLAGAVAGFGTHNYATAISPGGGYFSYTNNGDTLPIWTTERTPATPDQPAKTVPTHANRATALAISGDGSRIALASDGALYVTDVKAATGAAQTPIALTGSPVVNQDALVFAGDHDRLLAASGSRVSLWDLRQTARIADSTPIDTPLACNACSAPLLTAQPGGQAVAVVDGNGSSFTVGVPGSLQSLPADDMGGQLYGPPAWSRDGRRLILVDPHHDGAQLRAFTAGLPVSDRWSPPTPPGSEPEDPVAYARVSRDGRLIELRTSGVVQVRDMRSGAILRRVDGPRDMTPRDGGSNLTPAGHAVVDDTGAHAAIVDDVDQDHPVVVLTDVGRGTARTISGAAVSGIAFLDDELLVQRANGALEVYDADGATLRRTIDGDEQNVVGPVTDGRGTIAEERSDGTVTVIDFSSGDVLGRLILPTAYKFAKTGLAFTSDGRSLMAVTESQGPGTTGRLIRWRFTPRAWIEAACSSSGAPLSSSEWRQYMGTSAQPDLSCRP